MTAPRVLIVDDNPSYRRMLARFFQSRASGIEVLTASSGAEGLRAARERDPDVIVLDLNLDDINGFEVLRRLRAATERAPAKVLVISGLRIPHDVLRSAALGLEAHDFLEKTAGPAGMLARVRALLSRSADPGGRGSRDRDLGRLKIDRLRGQALVDDAPLKLGRRRFQLLCALAESPDGLPSRLLKDLVWGEHASLNVVAKTVNRLRGDLVAAAGRDLIASIPGGYKLAPLVSPARLS